MFLSARIVVAQQTFTIPVGTLYASVLRNQSPAKTARAGDDVPMEVLADVAVNGYVLIRQEAPVIGVVSRAKEAKSLGRRGHVAVALKYVESVTGEHVPVSGDRYESGKGKKAEVTTEVAVATFFYPTWTLVPIPEGKRFRNSTGHRVHCVCGWRHAG